MRIFLNIFFLIAINFTYSQDDYRTWIKGKVLYKNVNVSSANVINNTSQQATTTNDDGEFEIEVKLDDKLIFSSVQYQIRAVKITSEILKKNRLVVTVNENINELKEVIVTTEDVENFLDLKEEEFKGFDYDTDKSSRLENKAVRDRVISNGIDFVNIAKLIAKAFSNKTVEEQLKMKPSEILPLVFDDRFFENDLDLPQDQVMGFLIFIDKNMKTSSLLKQDKQFQLIDYLINKSKEFKSDQVN